MVASVIGRQFMKLISLLLVAQLAVACTAQGRDRAPPAPKFDIEPLSGLGGGTSLGASINNLGWIAGRSNLPGNSARHATLWKGGRLIDLGTLGGPNSAVLWPVKNVRGVLTGISQTAERDPRNETWSCGFFFPGAMATGYKCVGFRWANGQMTPLPTLGGTHGFATGTNHFLRTVGWAENTTVDPTCTPPQQLQFRAVVWGPNGRVERQLRPVGSHTTSAATAINDQGSVVGISGNCDQAVGRYSAISAVIWINGNPRVIPTFGGVAWNTPTAINADNVVVGFANANAASGGEFDPRAFIWTRSGGTKPLPRLANHATSQALGINRFRHAVGQTCTTDGTCGATLWMPGNKVYDLNALIGSSPLHLYSANDIDDFGRITGQAYDTVTDTYVAYKATPNLRR